MLHQDEALNAPSDSSFSVASDKRQEITASLSVAANSNMHETRRTSLAETAVDRDLLSEVNDVVSKSHCGYVKRQVLGDGDCGYTALGITRAQAAKLLKDNINDIGTILQYPIQEALLTKNFYDYLLIQDKTTILHKVTTDNANVHKQLASNLIIQLAYIDYDIQGKNIDAGYVHPRVLQAIAHIQHIELHLWQLNDKQMLIPHIVHAENYAAYVPPYHDNRRVDLLFVNNNHFDLLDLGYYTENIPEVGIYPFQHSFEKIESPKMKNLQANHDAMSHPPSGSFNATASHGGQAKVEVNITHQVLDTLSTQGTTHIEKMEVQSLFLSLPRVKNIKLEAKDKDLMSERCWSTEEVITTLKTNICAYIDSDSEQELYAPLEGKYLKREDPPFKLYDETIKYIYNQKLRSLPIFGDAGTGKTQFSENITRRLLEKEIDLITIYLPLTNYFSDTSLSNFLKDMLINLYGLSSDKSEVVITLGRTDQAFCFVLDGVDELLNKEPNHIDFIEKLNIYNRFKNVHCIFTSRHYVSGISNESLEGAFVPKDHNRACRDKVAEAWVLQPFGNAEKEIYIRLFIEKKLFQEATKVLIEGYIQRLHNIQYLYDVISTPIFIKMTMEVLDYLEAFYQHESENSRTEATVLGDLYDMFIFNLFLRARDEKPCRYKPPADHKIIKCYLVYCIDLANALQKKDVTDYSRDRGKKSPFDKFFCDQCDEKIFGDDDYSASDDFNRHRVGFHGAQEMLKIRTTGNGKSYGFFHDTIKSHFKNMDDAALLEGRRGQIEAFVDKKKYEDKAVIKSPGK